MRYIYFSCLIIALIFCCSACSYKQNQVLFEHKPTANDTLSKNNFAEVSEYKIAPQDILQIRNLQNIKYIVDEAPASSGASGVSGSGQGQTYQVEEDGTVALPVIGRVEVAGLSRLEASKKIEGLYLKSLLKDPIIELKIINLKVTLLGEVKVPGNYPLVKDKTKLVEMIGEAGGLTENANEKQVRIIRGSNGENQQTIDIDLRDLSSISSPKTILKNGDVIYIGQNKRAIRNEKLQNFSTLIQPALILLNTALVIFTLTR